MPREKNALKFPFYFCLLRLISCQISAIQKKYIHYSFRSIVLAFGQCKSTVKNLIQNQLLNNIDGSRISQVGTTQEGFPEST